MVSSLQLTSCVEWNGQSGVTDTHLVFRCSTVVFQFRPSGTHPLAPRWYTNEERNWDALSQKISDACRYTPESGYPKLEPELAMRAFTEGVPLAGRFVSERKHMIRRLRYNNHPPTASAADEVAKNLPRKKPIASMSRIHVSQHCSSRGLC
jgi:hypothetical protein